MREEEEEERDKGVGRSVGRSVDHAVAAQSDRHRIIGQLANVKINCLVNRYITYLL